MSTAEALVEAEGSLWRRILAHPFVAATAAGTLPEEAFDRWLVEDHFFVVGFRRFLARLVEVAPDEPARDLLAGAFGPVQAELDLFREEAARRGLDLGAEPCPTNLGYTSLLAAAPADGFDVGLTALYGAERAYLDAWRAVRERAAPDSPYRAFIHNWSSEAFAGWVDQLAGLLDRTVTGPPHPRIATAFSRVVRFELRFWDAVYRGETWETTDPSSEEQP